MRPAKRVPLGLLGVLHEYTCGVRPACGSLVIADVPASPPPRSLISADKTHQQMSWYSWDERLDWVGGMWAKEREFNLKRSALSFNLSANTLQSGFHLEKHVENLGVKVLASPVGHNSGDLILRVSRAVNARV